MLSVNNVTNNVFQNSSSVEMIPVVSAEWNINLFNQPYITTAGMGNPETFSSPSISVTDVSGQPEAMNGISTNMFQMSGSNTSLTYTVNTSGSKSAYKIITYIKTDSDLPIQVNAYAKGSSTQYGSTTIDVNSFGYVKVLTYIGSSGTSDPISSFTYTINLNTYNSATASSINVYYTQPQAYETTYFDYQNNTLWPTESPFSYFRPGESYVPSGNQDFSFPSGFRQITTSTISGVGTTSTPITPIIQNPGYTLATPPVPVYKSILPSDMAPYKYFVSEEATSGISNPSISAIYNPAINANKLVFKFNSIVATPVLNIFIDNYMINVDGLTNITPDNNGLLVLYWTGSVWTKNNWSTMPSFSSNGEISLYKSFNKISITQISSSIKQPFSSYSNSYVTKDASRMHIVEISPRIEIDLSPYVMELDITKQLDSKNNYIPISSINPNDASIILSAIPLTYNNGPIPIFSSQSNLSTNILYNMMRKNIKFYFGWNLISYFINQEVILNPSNPQQGQYIPAGIYYSNSWDETDIQTVKVTCYDIVNYLQTVPAPDYVASKKNIFDIITNILDMAGFTDYDYDSLYNVCNDSSSPMDLYYYFCNSQSSTVYDVLSELFLSHQIGAYIDEFGVMKFLSLSDIMKNKTSIATFNDNSIIQGGYSITNKAKPGSITVSYQQPKILQSLSLQNAKDVGSQQSPSFIYTTSNDVVWSQKNADSVGYNYLSESMYQNNNFFKMNNNDVLDIFHTYLLNNDGYAVIEDEVVSFLYKEYIIRDLSNLSNYETVYPKTDIELSSFINSFVKKYGVGLVKNDATITGASGTGTAITYTASNNYAVGQRVSVYGINPPQYNIIGTVVSANSSSFSIEGKSQGTYVSGGIAVGAGDSSYNIEIEPTGKISNVMRGMFGTVASDHLIISSAPGTGSSTTNKGLSEATVDNSYQITTGTTTSSIKTSALASPDNPVITKIQVVPNSNGKTIIYPTTYTDPGFKTYSTKFDLNGINLCSAGIFFNQQGSSAENSYFVELIQVNSFTSGLSGDVITTTYANPPKFKYYLVFYTASTSSSSSSPSVIAWSDVTGVAEFIKQNFEKVLYVNSGKGTPKYTYLTASDQYFNLRVAHKYSDGTDGEIQGEILGVFLNNVEITGWQIPKETDPLKIHDDTPSWTYGGKTYVWSSTPINTSTGLRQHVNFIQTTSPTLFTGTKFGFFTSVDPVFPDAISTPTNGSGEEISANFREIYGNEKALIEKSVNYYYQDKEFLNGLIQGQNLFSLHKSYMVQTNPDVVGINYYDVQYQTPAATSVDVMPIEYLWFYFPGIQPTDQQYYQKQLVDEYSLSYSTPINTGFRARMAITNNAGHMVYLTKQSDSINQFTVTLNLWTHEVVAPSDPEIIQRVLDPSNISEVMQVDSPWIQSKESANKLIDVIKVGNDGFSKDTSIQIFGNPLVQVGDILTFNYSLAGLINEKYLVHEVAHVFKNGLKTTLILNSLNYTAGY